MIENERFWPLFLSNLEAVVGRLPAHLLREEDIRSCLREALLSADPGYADPKFYCPEADKVDVHIRPVGAGHKKYLLELKLWHATLKHHPASNDALRSASKDGTAHHLRDFVKQRARASDGVGAYFVSLTQVDVHPQHGRRRWRKSGESGGFLSTDAGANQAGQRFLQDLLAPDAPPVADVRVPAFATGSGKAVNHFPETSMRLRQVEALRLASGGGADWACDFDFHVWEVLPAQGAVTTGVVESNGTKGAEMAKRADKAGSGGRPPAVGPIPPDEAFYAPIEAIIEGHFGGWRIEPHNRERFRSFQPEGALSGAIEGRAPQGRWLGFHCPNRVEWRELLHYETKLGAQDRLWIRLPDITDLASLTAPLRAGRCVLDDWR